jgi:peptide/nickel transport system substrate-binding protein
MTYHEEAKEMEPISRRQFLHVSALGAAGVALAACQPKTVIIKETVKETVVVAGTPEVIEKEVTTIVEKEKVVKETVIVEVAPPSKFEEAPEIVDLVAQGKLPPIDERMPLVPLVAPRKGGKYGGTMRLASTDTDPNDWNVRNNGAMQAIPMRLSEDLSGVVPNWYTDCAYSEDKTTIHCFIRKGSKFSDGEPHTVDDWIFWRDYVTADTDVTPVPFSYYQAEGEVLQIDKIDDYTFDIVFKLPAPMFVKSCFAHCLGFWGNHLMPAEYLKPFSIHFNPKADEEAKAAGWENWGALLFFKNKAEDSMEVGTPTTSAFQMTSVQPDSVRMSRNPYYHVVDQDGKHLPYIDEIAEEKVANSEVIYAKTLAGDIDRQGVPFKDYETYKNGEERGGFKIYDWTQVSNYLVFSWNQNFPDDTWRTIFQDVRFRRAMSVALNREEMNQVAFAGVATPSQFTCAKSVAAWKEEYATAYAQYDPDMANQLLDEIGLAWDDKHELRVLPTGQPAEMSTMFVDWMASPALELAIDNWLQVGIKVNYKLVDRSFTHDAYMGISEMVPLSCWGGDEIGSVLLASRPKWFVAPYTDETTLAPLWGRWYESNGKEGEAPPEHVQELYEAQRMWLQTGDLKYITILLEDNAENLWTVGTLVDIPNPQVINKDLRGLPDITPCGWDTMDAYHTYPEAWYFDR